LSEYAKETTHHNKVRLCKKGQLIHKETCRFERHILCREKKKREKEKRSLHLIECRGNPLIGEIGFVHVERGVIWRPKEAPVSVKQASLRGTGRPSHREGGQGKTRPKKKNVYGGPKKTRSPRPS